VETGSSRWTLSSAVTFAAAFLWFLDPILFNVRRSLVISSGFRPLFLLVHYAFPWFVYAVITLGTTALDTYSKVAFLVTDAPTKHAKNVCPLWKSDKSPVLQSFHANCY
jgi:hypothetical protein